MPISLPAKQVAWNRLLQSRCAYTSVNQAAGDVMFKVANELITTRAFTCKGSSTGTTGTGAMDGVFRWASGNDAKTRANSAVLPQSWVAITLAGGRGDVVFSYNSSADDVYNVWWSPGGLATVAAVDPAREPTATDQILINKFFTSSPTIVGATAAGDRLVSIWSRPDKGGFRVAIARAGAFEGLFGVDAFTPDEYGAGVTVVPATGFYINPAWLATGVGSYVALINASNATGAATNAQKRFIGRRTDGGGTSLEFAHKMKVVGVAATGTALQCVNDQTYAPELQGGATWLMKSFGLHSITASHRGDAGTLPDWYLSRISVADGDTAGSLEWICVESGASMWWDWDGATPVVMS